MTKLQFNETTYEFLIQRTQQQADARLIEKQGVVVINGERDYLLWYSYDPQVEDSPALYEVFNVDDTDATAFKQYGKQDFPFDMVQSMVQYIMKRNNN